MTSTTQILFNSPALHSLKRDQLVKLCKLHNIKASGKNSELIDRLKQRAADLPPEMAEIVDDQEEEDGLPGAFFKSPPPRPSEQWEMVMDDIEEVDETIGTMNSKGTLRSKGTAGEFGTNTSKSSVASSLKAFASSFGIKRAGTGKSAVSTVASTSSAPAALASVTTNPFSPSPEEPAPDPIPGNPSRPGVPAPANARLSTGTSAGITTTIRLISTSYGSPMPSPPRLAPHPVTFDLDMGTPGKSANVWPASPGTTGRLYPALPYEDLLPLPITKFAVPDSLPDSVTNSPSPMKVKSKAKQSETKSKTSTPDLVESKAAAKEECPAVTATPLRVTALQHKPLDKPDMFSPAKAPGSAKRPAGRISAAQNQPFLFGSPLPQHTMTNKDFGHAATSVLEEMNRRLAEAGVAKVDEKILDGEHKPQSDVFGMVAKPGHKKTDSGDRFAKAHEEAFNKMDSIANHYAARRVLHPPPESNAVAAGSKRKSDALVAHAGATPAAKRRSVATARVISQGSRKHMIPGGFGDEEEDEEDESHEEEAGDRRASKRMRVVETADVHKGRRVSLLPPHEGQTEEDREKEEKRKEREREAVKRKLEASKARRRSSRISGGRTAPPAKPSRFGFLASAKSLVRNVWNMGAGGTSKVPVAKPPPAPKVAANVAGSSKGHARVPSGSTLLKPTSSSVAKAQPANTYQASTTSSSHSRPPIPSFSSKAAVLESAAARASQAASQSNTGASRISVKPTSTSGPSSMGTRGSIAVPVHANVSSLGAKKSMGPPAAPPSRIPSGTAHSHKRTVSGTFMAPTASSLAKRHGQMGVASRETTPALSESSRPFASPITNKLGSPHSPRPQQIFSRPLDGFGSKSPSPAPPEKPAHAAQSLAGAASALMARSSENENPTAARSQLPKPKPLAPRKPRISRSRVIAKLGAQRAAASSGSSAVAPAPSGRARSSIGAAPRRSLGVKQHRVSGADVMMSAKKKARQSEMARRKSRLAGSSAGLAPRGASVDVSMDIDG